MQPNWTYTFEDCVGFWDMRARSKAHHPFHGQTAMSGSTRMAWFDFSRHAERGLWNRPRQLQAKVAQGAEDRNHGLFAYPVLMDATFLTYKT